MRSKHPQLRYRSVHLNAVWSMYRASPLCIRYPLNRDRPHVMLHSQWTNSCAARRGTNALQLLHPAVGRKTPNRETQGLGRRCSSIFFFGRDASTTETTDGSLSALHRDRTERVFHGTTEGAGSRGCFEAQRSCGRGTWGGGRLAGRAGGHRRRHLLHLRELHAAVRRCSRPHRRIGRRCDHQLSGLLRCRHSVGRLPLPGTTSVAGRWSRKGAGEIG